MRSRFMRLKWMAAAAGLGSVLLVSHAALAACTNDVDCPGAQCGGQVCDWNIDPVAHACVPAGGGPKGQDGWCTTSADCKCMGMGATCVGVYCTFTTPPDAGGASNGGTSGSGGAAAGTGGSTGTGGATSGTDAGTKPSSGGGGCAVAGTGGTSLFGVLATLAALASRRRRSRRPVA